MGGTSMADDWEMPLPAKARTLVLLGKAGNGKSATGNSILGKDAFDSKFSSSGVTTTCDMQTTVLKGGQVLNVIDTPGLFDLSEGSANIVKEILKCIVLAKDGVDAVLFVLSVRTRFSKEEQDTFQSLQSIFGPKMTNYMIVVFTNGDLLKEDDTSKATMAYIESFPEPLKKLISSCQNRMVIFDNNTKEETQRIKQFQQLMSLVNMIIGENGQSYSIDDLLEELKKGKALKLHDREEGVKSSGVCVEKEEITLKEMLKPYVEELSQIKEVSSELEKTTLKLEMKLKEEEAARVKAENIANEEIRKLRENLEKAQRETAELRREKEKKTENDEIRKLRENLEKAQKETAELRLERDGNSCAIL